MEEARAEVDVDQAERLELPAAQPRIERPLASADAVPFPLAGFATGATAGGSSRSERQGASCALSEVSRAWGPSDRDRATRVGPETTRAVLVPIGP
jgi:hypothetical protein